MAFELHVQTPPQPPYDAVRDCWRTLDDAGLAAIWSWDHFFTEWTSGDFEGWTLLAGLAEATSITRVGVFVTAATFRHPSVFAKMVTTVDHISGGRLITGLGAARLPSEHDAFGIDFPSGGERVRRLRETVDVLEGLSTGEPFSYSGRHATLRDAKGIPVPVQRPRPPILIGAHGAKMLELTARRAEYWNTFLPPEPFRATNAHVSALCEAAGREPTALKRIPAVAIANATRDLAERYRDAGADGLLLVARDNDASAILPVVEDVRL